LIIVQANARILPTSGAEYLVYLRNQYKDCESWDDGKISAKDFLQVPLWFEENVEQDTSKFDRPAKLKQALAHLFGAVEINEGKFQEDGDENIVVEEGDEGSANDEKESEKEVDMDDEEKLKERSEEIADKEQSQESVNTRRRSEEFDNEPRPDSDEPTTPGLNSNGIGAAILNEHELAITDDARVDINRFLMMCTLDSDNSKSGLEKAFAMFSDRDDYGLTTTQMHAVCNYWFHVVADSHRDTTVKSIFPMVHIIK
jgi:hypothetical protein